MGTNNLTTKNDGDVASADDVNQYKTAMSGDIVPRNSSGVPTDESGSFGTPTYKAKNTEVVNGHFFTGMIIPFHDFNGTVSPGQGWMKCNGDVVNETNYDAIHGSGAWAIYVVTSDLDGLNLPDLAAKYLVGTAATSQDGSSPITFEGNSDHEVDIAHVHAIGSHVHKWYNATGTGLSDDDQSFTSVGGAQGLGQRQKGTGSHAIMSQPGSSNSLIGDTSDDLFTDSQDLGSPDSQLSATQSVQPHSAAVEYWIRVV